MEPVTGKRVGTTDLYILTPFLVHWAEANSQSLEVFAIGDWNAGTNVDWVSLSKDGNILTVTMSQNDTEEVRTGEVYITCGNDTVTLPVAQEYGNGLISRKTENAILEKNVACKFMNYLWGQGTVKYTGKSFLRWWESYECTKEKVE